MGTMRGGRYYRRLSCNELCLLTTLVCTLTGSHLVYAGVIPTFLLEPESQTVSHHSPVTLQCAVLPPTATTSWLFNGAPLDPSAHRGLRVEGSNLHFPHFSHGDEDSSNDGEYRCAATTEAGTVVSRPAVLSKPVLRRFPPSDNITITVVEGSYVTLPCIAPESRPPARVEVQTSDGRLLDSARGNVQRLPSGSVVLRSVRMDDSGVYRCVAFNPSSGNNRTAPHVIVLKVTPRSQGGNQGQATVIVGLSTPELRVANNETVLLECPTAGYRASTIKWTKYGGQLSNTSVQDTYGNLQIPAVTLHDGGTYFCQTPAGQSLQISLEVRTLPVVFVPQQEKFVTASAGESVEISCHGDAFPPPNVTWFYNGDVLGQRRIFARGNEHSLVLDKVTEEDAGIYICELSNAVGQASTVIRLVVVQEADGKGAAGSDLHPSNGPALNGTSGDTITIDTDETGVANNKNNGSEDPDSNKRRKNDRKRKQGKKKNRRRKNKKNRGRAKKDKKVPPSVPTVTQLSDTSVVVSWNVRENDGLPITMFKIQYKEVHPNKGTWRTDDQEIDKNDRRHEVSRLKAGRSYKFRVAAVYDNYDHAFGPNSKRVHLKVESYPELHPPKVTPRIVEVIPLIYQNIYAIHIKWQYVPVDASSIKGFLIFYKPFDSEEEFEKLPLKGGGITQHTLTDLKPDTDYSIKMQSYNSAGASKFSNTVVKRTKPPQGQTSRDMPTPVPPVDKDETEPTTSRREPGGLDQPVILGIVLGIMLLLLVVFIAMCWWKQRQQKRRNLNAEHTAKFQDQAQRIYTESLRKKHPNGGPYPLNGMNGLSLANGHGPHGQHKMNIDTNPLAEMDVQRSQTPTSRDQYKGKTYHHGNGMVPNGTIPGYGHHNSDNNFNNIRHTVSSDNVHESSGMIPNGITINNMGSLSHVSRNGGYNSQPYHPSSQSRSSISSFAHDSHQRRHAGSLSHSDEGDSPDEEDPLAGERIHPSSREKTPTHSTFGHVKGLSLSARDRLDRSRDPSPDRMQCYGYGPTPSYDSVLGLGYGGLMLGGGAVDGSGFHLRSPVTSPSPTSSSHSGKHKRRRKRPHSGREHATKDQATNTDLSSNEGTIEFTMFNKSPSSSVSTGSDHSNSNSEGRTVTPYHLHSGVAMVTTPKHSVAMMTTSSTPLPVGPL